MDLTRYARHLVLDGVGILGQERLARGRVLVVGAGGLGSPVLLYLAAAGVGSITVADDDSVALSNLQRQVLHDTAAVGQPKVHSAVTRLRALNPDVAVTPLTRRIDGIAAGKLVAGFDVVVDGTDNFGTRYALSDACAAARVPYVYGSVQRFEGQVAVLCTGEAPCYRCLFPEPPAPGTVPSCGEAGVLGVLPGIVGTMQAAEALKLLLGIGQPLTGRLLLVDALRMHFHEVRLDRDPACRACSAGAGRSTDETTRARLPADQRDDGDGPLSPTELKVRLDRGDDLVLLDVREPQEWDVAHIAGAVHIPMGTVPERAGTLDRDAETVVYCHHGVRSAAVVNWLRSAGFRCTRNLAGGIDRWSVDVDPRVPRY